MIFTLAGCADFSRGMPSEPTPTETLGASPSDFTPTGDWTPTAPLLSYVDDVYPLLDASCATCHAIPNTPFVLTGDPGTDYPGVNDQVDRDAPEESGLLLKAIGSSGHGGGAILSQGSDEYNVLLDWIVGGASDDS